MNAEELKTVEQLSAFLNGTQSVAFAVAGDKDACYRWIERTLLRFGHRGLSKADKGVVIAYLMNVSGYRAARLDLRVPSVQSAPVIDVSAQAAPFREDSAPGCEHR